MSIEFTIYLQNFWHSFILSASAPFYTCNHTKSPTLNIPFFKLSVILSAEYAFPPPLPKGAGRLTIIPIQKEHIPALTTLAAEAFLSAPAYRHLMPDVRVRRAFLQHFLHFRLLFSLRSDYAFTTDTLDAVAVWLPPEVRMKNRDFLSPDLFRGIYTAGLGPVRQLAPLAVSPALQGQGVGSALLRHGLKIIDSQMGTLFLDTQEQRTADYYSRFGFETVERQYINGTDIPIIGMVRNPQ